MKGVKSVLLDSSFCIRLLKIDADFHQNAVDYFEYLGKSHNLKFEFFDLSIPLNDKLGRLF
jgi:hypothetical protein